MDLTKWCNLGAIRFVILVVTSGVALAQVTCAPGLKFPGYTVPQGDIVIEYGKPLDIMCVLFKNADYPNASRLLSFSRNNKSLPPEMIEIVNSTAIRLHIDHPPKVTTDSYTCLMEDKSVCINFVSVGVKPQPVTDFTCIGDNFETLTCKWTAPNNYVKTDYALQFMLGTYRSSRYAFGCPLIEPDDEQENGLKCVWSTSTKPPYRQVHDFYNFTLTMSNKFGTNKLEKNFNHFAHVLPGPPQNLTVISKTTSSLYLHWVVPTAMQTFPPGVHHRVMYQCEFEGRKWKQAAIITNKGSGREMYFNLTNIKHAYDLCSVNVSLRSAYASPTDDSMWSRNTQLTARTVSKEPEYPPETNVGSFQVVAFGSSLETRGAYIYWKQIKGKQRNGPEFRYNVSVDGNESIRPIEITHAYAKFENLSISTSYTFRIWSENVNGSSAEQSIVHIPRQTDRVKEPLSFTKVEFGGGEYELTWEPPRLKRDQQITNYTIFWCEDFRDRPHQCNGTVDWKIVPSTDKTYKTKSLDKSKIYQFAISANIENSTSGMLWAACAIIHSNNMGKIRNVWISRCGSTFIEVGWKLDCSDRIGSVEGFVVYYCPTKSHVNTECKAPQKNMTFIGDTSVSNVNITGLNPYTSYMLSVAVKTRHTTYSQQSDPLYNMTEEAAPNTPPTSVVPGDITNTTISLTWEPPEPMNGILQRYVVFYNEHSREVRNGSHVMLQGLDSYKNYSVSVMACTRECSGRSAPLLITTKMGYPSRIDRPFVDRRNDSTISISWNRARDPRGKNDYYIVRVKQKYQRENRTKDVIVSDRRYVIDNCGDGGKYNTFYVSVRAVNVYENETWEGPWSQEFENYCYTPVNYIMYILVAVVVLFFFGMAFLFNRLYHHCKRMRDVEVKLPPGLAPAMVEPTRMPWSSEGLQEKHESHATPDEELLLIKMSEARHFSGDSSGCSSGHESVTSSIDSGGTHISSSSDSGTEQPPGNYCVLGVVPKADAAYVPVKVVDPVDGPFKVCDPSNDPSPYVKSGDPYVKSGDPYVKSGDPVKTASPGYIPFNLTEPIGKSSGYVVAGIKNCNGYIPFNQTESVRNTEYVVAGVKNCKLD